MLVSDRPETNVVFSSWRKNLQPSRVDVLRAADDLVASGLIEDYALGGALAVIYYVEPFTTSDANIIFVAAEKGLTSALESVA